MRFFNQIGEFDWFLVSGFWFLVVVKRVGDMLVFPLQ